VWKTVKGVFLALFCCKNDMKTGPFFDDFGLGCFLSCLLSIDWTDCGGGNMPKK
jgi:hypothetical protein